MAHRRQEVRDAVAAALVGKTAAADRVFRSRLAPITQDSLTDDGPALMVYVRSEKIGDEDYPITGEDGAVKRTLTFTVEAVVKGTDDVDTDLDAIAVQVEDVLEDFVIPGFGVAEARLAETEIDISDAFSAPVGSIALTYRLAYWTPWRTRAGDPVPTVDLARPKGDPREQLPLHPGALTLAEEERFLAGEA